MIDPQFFAMAAEFRQWLARTMMRPDASAKQTSVTVYVKRRTGPPPGPVPRA